MRKRLVALALLLTFAHGSEVGVKAQEMPAQKAQAISATTSPSDLARAALAAHGGEKFRNMKSMVQSGSAELHLPGSNQPVRGTFVISLETAGRYRIEVEAGFSFKQIFNGQQSHSSLRSLLLPDPSKYGLSQLAKYDQPGYTVTALPDKEQMRGFRVKAPDRSATDFFVDAATGRVKLYSVILDDNIFDFEMKNYEEVEGIPTPVAFALRMELTRGVFTLDFKAKETKVNQPLAPELFTIPK